MTRKEPRMQVLAAGRCLPGLRRLDIHKPPHSGSTASLSTGTGYPSTLGPEAWNPESGQKWLSYWRPPATTLSRIPQEFLITERRRCNFLSDPLGKFLRVQGRSSLASPLPHGFHKLSSGLVSGMKRLRGSRPRQANRGKRLSSSAARLGCLEHQFVETHGRETGFLHLSTRIALQRGTASGPIT